MKTITENTAEILLLIFLIITFLQSSLDKVFDWKGNLSWLKDHFAQSSLRQIVPAMFFIITITELAAGILSALGLVQILRGAGNNFAFL
ncbi:MAG: DoxX family protein, partial [Robiginitalea sp.]